MPWIESLFVGYFSKNKSVQAAAMFLNLFYEHNVSNWNISFVKYYI